MKIEEAMRICAERKSSNPNLTNEDWFNVGKAHQVLAAEYLRILPDITETAKGVAQDTHADHAQAAIDRAVKAEREETWQKVRWLVLAVQAAHWPDASEDVKQEAFLRALEIQDILNGEDTE